MLGQYLKPIGCLHTRAHIILDILQDSTAHWPAKSPVRRPMSVIAAAHSSIQLIPGMLMGRVPPSGLIKLPFWKGESILRTHSFLQSINALFFATGDDLKPGHSPLTPPYPETRGLIPKHLQPQELHDTRILKVGYLVRTLQVSSICKETEY